MKLRIACIIPARGGSKGVPRKNIKLLGGVPLLAYTIRAAQAVEDLFEVIAVSTEDTEIAAVAREYKAEVIDRPKEMAEDSAKSEPVLTHGLEILEKTEKRFDGVLLLSPTNPFRNSQYIKEAVNLFSSEVFDTVVGLVPVYKYQYRPETANAVPLWRERKNRQEGRDPVWLENGALYLARADLVRQGKIFGTRLGCVAMDELSSINIDSPVDWLHAEAVVASGDFKVFHP